MHGSKWLFLPAISLAFAGCSSKSLMKPDCHSCTVEEQEWKEFSWASIEGKWRGTVESFQNSRESGKKAKTEKPVQLGFVNAKKFLEGRAAVCSSLPNEALVLNGLLWELATSEAGREYEIFLPAEEGKAAYGRLTFSKVNGKERCQFRRLGRVMGKNRLGLPTVSFSDRNSTKGRTLASAAPQQEISLEFLRYAVTDKAVAFDAKGRKPASVNDQERPTLIFRIFKIATSTAQPNAEWNGTEEHIYRLWRE